MYLNYCKGLRFEEDPDYDYLRRLFRNLAKKNEIEYDWIFDWSQWNNKNSPTVNPPESYFFPKPANAGLIRMQVLLEGSYINLLKVLSNKNSEKNSFSLIVKPILKT